MLVSHSNYHCTHPSFASSDSPRVQSRTSPQYTYTKLLAICLLTHWATYHASFRALVSSGPRAGCVKGLLTVEDTTSILERLPEGDGLNELCIVCVWRGAPPAQGEAHHHYHRV